MEVAVEETADSAEEEDQVLETVEAEYRSEEASEEIEVVVAAVVEVAEDVAEEVPVRTYFKLGIKRCRWRFQRRSQSVHRAPQT